MPEVGKVITQLNGFTGGPGYSSHHFFGDPMSPSTCQDAVDDVGAFWNGMWGQMATGSSFSIQPDVHVFDEVTGALIRVETTTPPSQTASTAAGVYAAGVGAVATWTTATVHGSKQLKGRTFLVPLNAGAYEANGTIMGVALTPMRAAAATLAAVANFGVWGRPIDGAGGNWGSATGGTVRDHIAWLSSRRD